MRRKTIVHAELPVTSKVARRFTDLLWLWVPLAIAVGLFVPGIVILQPLTLLFLALIVGGVALTLDLVGFRGLARPVMLRWLGGHIVIVPIAWGIGHLLGLDAIYIAGLVLLGASTPDMTAPLLSRIARANTHVTMLLLVAAGTLSVILIPLWAILLIDPALRVPLHELGRVLALGLLLPFIAGTLIHRSAPRTLARYQDHSLAVSTLATILITALVAAVNRPLLLDAFRTLPLLHIILSAGILFASGMVVGRLVGLGTRATHRGGLFIPGTREYALAAALVLAAGFPPEAAILPLVFGAIQMVLAPLIAHAMAHKAPPAPPTG